MGAMAKLTPMMAQYREVKAKYSDCILFFRLGDFYEMFFEDAHEASKLLDIVLTSRNKGDHKAPMCGIPYHAASQYIAKLIKAGRKVAICEQLSDPSQSGIVERDVIRVITPGTTLDEKILETKANNYVASVVSDGKKYGIAFADVTTGEFKVFETENLTEEIERVAPTECIVEPGKKLSLKNGIYVYEFESFKDPKSLLLDHFGISSLDSFGIQDMELAVVASGRLLHYLMEIQKTDLAHIKEIRLHSPSDFMPIDEASFRNLEIFTTLRDNKKEGSLISVLDETITSMGGRMLRRWLLRPLNNAEQITKRLDAVSWLTKNQSALLDLREILKDISDIERILGRLSLNTGNARDLIALEKSFSRIPDIKKLLISCDASLLSEVTANLFELPNLISLLSKAICDEPPFSTREGGIIRESFSEELDKLRKISREGKSFIKELQLREIERTGIQSLKVRYNSVFGYYIEISRSNLSSVPADYIRKQTLVNAERFITPELKEYEETVLNAEEKICELEYKIFNEIRESVTAETIDIQKTAESIGMLDVLCSFAHTALHSNYCKPEIIDDYVIDIKNGRHPVLEKLNFACEFVPNDTLLDKSNSFALITGPNMAGKSCYLRQVALITFMAHVGSFVPAGMAKICLTDRIFTRIGASDNLTRGQSTFMVEMQETSYILHNATSKSLVILDEIGRGTSTYDGMSIAWAIMEHIHNKIGAKTLFATHYHELISVAEKLERAKNYNFAIKETAQNGIVFLYKLFDGGVDKSYGVSVARLAGLPVSVTQNAEKILSELEVGKEVVPKDQLGLFTPDREHKTLRELREIDTDTMTPLDALRKLDELKRSAE